MSYRFNKQRAIFAQQRKDFKLMFMQVYIEFSDFSRQRITSYLKKKISKKDLRKAH